MERSKHGVLIRLAEQMRRNNPAQIVECLRVLDSSAVQDKLVCYVELLERWNRRVDLVAPASLDQIFNKHVLDSVCAVNLSLARLPAPPEIAVDIGSGAGFPGILLGLAAPDSRVLLVEPRKKRAAFLKEVRRTLDMSAEVIESRVEEIPQDVLSMNTVDLAMSRAVGSYDSILPAIAPKLKSSGICSLMVGSNSVFSFAGFSGERIEYKLAENDPRALLLLQRST